MSQDFDTPTSINQQVNDFMHEMQQRTGAGTDFLGTVRPAVQKMFQTVSAEQLPEAKQSFIRKAELHVQTLAHLSNTLLHLDELSAQEKEHPALTPGMLRQLEFTRGIVVNTLLKTYGGFGARVTILG